MAKGSSPRRYRCRGGAFVLVAEADATLGQIIGRHFDGYAVSDHHADPVLLHLARGVGQSLMAVGKLDAKARIRQAFPDDAVYLDYVFLGHGVIQ